MTAKADEGRWTRSCSSYTGDRRKEELSPLSVTFLMTEDWEALCLLERRRGGIWLTFLSRAANLKIRSEYLCERWPLAMLVAWADTEPLNCFDSVYQPWTCYIMDTIMRRKAKVVPLSLSLAHKHTAHPYPPSITPLINPVNMWELLK